MAESSNDTASGIGVAIFLVMAGPVFAFVPLYFGLGGFWAYVFVVLAMLSLAIAFAGAGLELTKEGFTGQPVWEDLGFAMGFGVLGAMFHLGTLLNVPGFVVIIFKVVVVFMMVLSAAFLGMALGHVLVEARTRPAATQEGERRRPSWLALGGAFAIWLTTVGLNVAQIYKLLKQ